MSIESSSLYISVETLPEPIVQSDRYFHPELGYVCPAPRFRRELRLACWAGVCGVVIGAAGVIALSRGERAVNPPSPAPPAAVQVTSRPHETKQADTRKPADAVRDEAAPPRDEVKSARATQAPLQPSVQFKAVNTESGSACADLLSRSFQRECLADKLHQVRRRTDNGPELARVHLGRLAPLVETEVPSPAPPESAAAASQVATLSAATANTASATPHAQETPPERAPAASMSNAKAPSGVRSQSRSKRREQPVKSVSLGPDSGSATVARTYAREGSFPRTVFWDWSREQ
jgi:hypothetical protein